MDIYNFGRKFLSWILTFVLAIALLWGTWKWYSTNEQKKNWDYVKPRMLRYVQTINMTYDSVQFGGSTNKTFGEREVGAVFFNARIARMPELSGDILINFKVKQYEYDGHGRKSWSVTPDYLVNNGIFLKPYELIQKVKKKKEKERLSKITDDTWKKVRHLYRSQLNAIGIAIFEDTIINMKVNIHDQTIILLRTMADCRDQRKYRKWFGDKSLPCNYDYDRPTYFKFRYDPMGILEFITNPWYSSGIEILHGDYIWDVYKERDALKKGKPESPVLKRSISTIYSP